MFMSICSIIFNVLAEICFMFGIFFLIMIVIIVVDAFLYARRRKKIEREIEEYTSLQRLSEYKKKEGE